MVKQASCDVSDRNDKTFSISGWQSLAVGSAPPCVDIVNRSTPRLGMAVGGDQAKTGETRY